MTARWRHRPSVPRSRATFVLARERECARKADGYVEVVDFQSHPDFLPGRIAGHNPLTINGFEGDRRVSFIRRITVSELGSRGRTSPCGVGAAGTVVAGARSKKRSQSKPPRLNLWITVARSQDRENEANAVMSLFFNQLEPKWGRFLARGRSLGSVAKCGGTFTCNSYMPPGAHGINEANRSHYHQAFYLQRDAAKIAQTKPLWLFSSFSDTYSQNKADFLSVKAAEISVLIRWPEEPRLISPAGKVMLGAGREP